jgi:hypothetical protein
MTMAGTPCPYQGKIGAEASLAWQQNPQDRPDYKEAKAKFFKECVGSPNTSGIKKSRRTCAEEFNKGS